MKLKIDFSLPKLVKFRVGLQLGFDVGAKVDLRLRLRGGDPMRWRAAIAPSGTKHAELPEPEAFVTHTRDLPQA
ncbi:MAG: hypothetical protein JWM53_1748 [bacterium]|nr:hypothetical protein [bacterium]